MPLEIKELHIKATVDNNNQQSGASSQQSASGTDPQLVQTIVEQVLEILQKRAER